MFLHVFILLTFCIVGYVINFILVHDKFNHLL